MRESFKKTFQFVTIIFFVLYSFDSAMAANCEKYVKELNEMNKAQVALLTSMSNNHEMFATSMESYSEALDLTAGRAYKTVGKNMTSAAESFRERGEKGQAQAQQLDFYTKKLITKISQCLSK